MRISIGCIIFGFIVFGFQNCSKPVSFSADAGSGLVHKIDTGDGDGDEVIIPNDDDGSSDEDDDSVVDHDDDDSDSDDDSAVESDHGYVCILEGPGSSVRVGFDEELVVVGSTIKEVCMSEHACLDIVSQKFSVKSAERRGFCPNKNKHVVEINDADIEELISKQ